MSFDPNDPRITAYLFGELDGDQNAAFQSEMADSEPLRNLVEETRRTLDRLSSELKDEPEMAMSDAQRKSVAEEITKAHAAGLAGGNVAGAKAPQSRFSRHRVAAVVALAASLLIICGVAYSVHRQYQARQVAAVDAYVESRLAARRQADDARSSLHEELKGMDTVDELLDHLEKAPDFTPPTTEGLPMAEYKEGPVSPSRERGNERQQVQLAGEQMRGGRGVPAAAEAASSDRRYVRVSPMPMFSEVGEVSTFEASAGADRAKGSRGRQSGEMAGSAAGGGMGAMGGMGGMAGPATAPGGGYGGAGFGGEYGAGGGSGSGSSSGYEYYESEARGRVASGEAVRTGTYGGDAGGYGMGSNGPAPTDLAGGTNTRSYRDEMLERQRLAPTRQHALGTSPAGISPGYVTDFEFGSGDSGDKFDPIVENPFKTASENLLSTFSIDVDTASYAKVRMHLMQNGMMPRWDAVRIEELLNYFTYDYAPPQDDAPFAAHIEVADCPWTPAHRLVRIGIKGKDIDRDKRPTSNLVFLLDVSGSMKPQNKLPLVKHGMKMLVDQLGENDQIAIVVYAGAAGLVLDSTTGDQKQVILDALDRLHAGGSTNGGEGIQLAYQMALDNFVPGGVNRVILCTDGDFNVGVTGTDELVRLAEENAKAQIFLSVLGFGMGNHNDSMLEQISNKGNGNYAFIDTDSEARKVLVEQMTGTLVTIAKDVKIQVDFNPVEVAAYRLIGYENRILAAEDFNNDQKDAGEIGAGHTVTALYEIVPAGTETPAATPPVDGSRYWTKGKPSKVAKSGEMLTLRMRYKQPDGDTSALLQFPVQDEGKKFGQASKDFRFAAAVASFGMLLRDSQYKGNATYAGVLETATEAASGDTSGYRGEFLKMIARAKELCGQ